MQTKMKRLTSSLVVLSLAIGSVVLLAGCGKPPAPGGKIVIGMTLPSSSHPFFIYLKKNVMDEAEKLGVKVISADAEDAAAKQMSIVEDFISRGVDGVLISPISADALVPAVEALNKANIPVATVDRKVNGGEILVHVGADNVEGGRVAARYILEKLGGKGGVIEIEGTPGASPAIERKRGFDEVVAASGVKLLASQTADFKRATGQSVMENLLQARSDFQAVYAANDEMMLGAIEAMDARGVDLSRVVTVGYDAIADAMQSIKSGRLTASVEQYPGQQARKALRFLVEKIRDGKLPPSKEVYITPVAIDKNNLEKAERKE